LANWKYHLRTLALEVLLSRWIRTLACWCKLVLISCRNWDDLHQRWWIYTKQAVVSDRLYLSLLRMTAKCEEVVRKTLLISFLKEGLHYSSQSIFQMCPKDWFPIRFHTQNHSGVKTHNCFSTRKSQKFLDLLKFLSQLSS